MSRAEGFQRMDVATSIHRDPKFRRIARERPEHLAPAFMAYVSLMGESWEEDDRLTMAEGWPLLLPWDEAVVLTMSQVGLLDAEFRIPSRVWDGWEGRVKERRELNRERWRSAAATQRAKRRNGESARTPRGRGEDSARGHRPQSSTQSSASVPSVVPPPTEEGTDRARPRDAGGARGPERAGDILARRFEDDG
jgi:hypothetical protein